MTEGQFDRLKLIIGAEGLKTLQCSRVAICGLGGVGSYAAESISRSGVGGITLIDFDFVHISNINRQIPALISNIGRPKVDILAERIWNINSRIELIVKKERITTDNVAMTIGHPDYVVDAIDDLAAKPAIIRYCLNNNIPIVSSMGTGNKLAPEKLRIADISETHTCPLARKLRKELRNYGIEKGLKVVFSEENPISIDTSNIEEEGKVIGSSSFVPPVAGLYLASVVIRDLLDISY